MYVISPLDQLIFSLSQTEKRYFKLSAQRHALNGKNIYLSIFEAISAANPKLQEELAAIVLPEQWASHKHYLFQMILKAMRGHESGKGVDQQLREMLQDITFLEGKRLHEPLLKLLSKAKKYAEAYDRLPACLQILDVERRLVKLLEQSRLNEELERIDAERKDLIVRMDIHYSYVELFDNIFTTLRQQIRIHRNEATARIEGLLKSELLTNRELPRSFQAHSYFRICNAFCHQLLGDFPKAATYYEEVISLWDEHAHWISEEPHQYQRVLSNYLSSCQFSDRWEPFPVTLARMKSLEGKSIEEQAEHFSNYYFFQLVYQMNTWNLEEAHAMAPEVEAGLTRFEGKLPESRRVTFLYNMMVVHLFLGKHRDAVRWLTKLINGPQTEVRQDLQRAARLFLLLLHHELGNFDLYEHLFSTVRRFLSPQGLNEFEELVLDFLKARYQHPHLPWPRAEAELFVGKLEALSAAYSDAHFLGIREFIVWAQAKTAGRGMV